MKKKKISDVKLDSTLYYRATYMTSSGDQEQEVFISDSMDHAREYATTVNMHGRSLLQLEEFQELIDSLL